jgi:hypothetical protein
MLLAPKFAEGMQGALFIDMFFAALMFGTYIIYEFRRNGYGMRAQAAVSIEVMLLGDLILRGWFWYFRILSNAGHDIEWMKAWPVAPIGMSVQMMGVLCLIRVFSPDGWSRQTWLAVGVVSVIVACVSAFGWW